MSHTTPDRDRPTGDAATEPRSSAAHHAHDATWRHVLDALRRAGEHAGRNTADWWAQDTVGGRATGDTAATARAVLAGIDDGDPAVLDALPVCEVSGPCADTHTEASPCASLYAEAAPAEAPGWGDLDGPRRDEATEAYRDGFVTAAHDRVAEHCRTALPDNDTGPRPRRRAA